MSNKKREKVQDLGSNSLSVASLIAVSIITIVGFGITGVVEGALPRWILGGCAVSAFEWLFFYEF